MQIDTNTAIQAMLQAAGPSPAVRVEIDMAVQKKVMETAEATVQTLLAGLDPTRGRHIDLRV
jgi:hypothetical protein